MIEVRKIKHQIEEGVVSRMMMCSTLVCRLEGVLRDLIHENNVVHHHQQENDEYDQAQQVRKDLNKIYMIDYMIENNCRIKLTVQ